MPEETVRYEERDSIAIITLNRPDRLNTLTESVVQGVADGIDAATASKEVRAIVLRGEGRVFTAGYDLVSMEGAGWRSPFDAPSPCTAQSRPLSHCSITLSIRSGNLKRSATGRAIHAAANSSAAESIGRPSTDFERRPSTPVGTSPTNVMR